MQPDESHGSAGQSFGAADAGSDDRVRDFLARHGGRGNRQDRAGEIVAGLCGWSEVYAADGYVLRCEWSRIGGRQEMHFIEKPARPEPR